jgi:rubrerythrin
MKRSLTSLTPQEALHTAVFIEERNAELYHRFAEMFVEFRDLESLEIAGVFWDMAVEESHHSTMLQQRYSERYGNSACSLTEEDIEEMIEVPRLEDGKIFDADRDKEALSPRERALHVALTAEQSARKFYANISEKALDPVMRRFYRELSEFEEGHVTFLERKLAESATAENNGGTLN